MTIHQLAGESRLFTAAQVRALDRVAIEECGIPGFTLMRRAARSTFELVMTHWPDASEVLVFCGSGNNAGDGYLIAALAANEGIATRCIVVADPGKLQGDARAAHQACLEAGVLPVSWPAFSEMQATPGAVLVDALLGIGLQRAVTGDYADAVAWINASSAPVVAVDIPSGLNADSGAVMGAAVHARITCSFIGLKQGLFTGAGPGCCGAVHYADLDVPEDIVDSADGSAALLGKDLVARLLPPRSPASHKGTHGHVLVIGGNHGMSGAVRMAGEAALRAGAGQVTVATRPAHCVTITQHRPELMCRGIDTAQDLAPLLERASVVAIGPGLGTDAWAETLVAAVLDQGLPVILDADALNIIAKQEVTALSGDTIITPHPGEAGRLLECSAAEVQRDRFSGAARLTAALGCVTVLKGAGTLIVDAQGTSLCPFGNPGMAVAGMGDLLTGIVAAMRAQDHSAGDAARLAVLIHALAGDSAAQQGGERGMLPGDLLPWIRAWVNGAE